MENFIKDRILDSIEVKSRLVSDAVLIDGIDNAIEACISCFQNDGKVLFCGNGGSAADAQHLAAEFSGRFYYDRKPLYSEALHVNTSYLTAVANDYSYEMIYERLIQAKGKPGDILFGLSTSGNSENVIRAIHAAADKGMTTIGMTGKGGGKMRDLCSLIIKVPSQDTPRIQECHMLIGHIICESVEKRLFPQNDS